MVSGPAAGGLKRHVEQLAAGLPNLGFEIAVASPQANAFAIQPWFPFNLGDRPRPGPDLRALGQLRRVTANWRPDLIHAHGAKAALFALLAFPLGRPGVIVTYHNRWLGGPLTLPLRLLAPRARASVAVSRAVARTLSEHRIHAHGLQVIVNGIDPDAFFPRLQHDQGTLPEFLFLGRLTEEKGIPLLLDTARLLEGSAALRLVVAGDGPLRDRVAAEAARPRSIIEYLGSQKDVLVLYHRSSAVVMPSQSEGLPMTALEAMACGLPLIASAVGGLPELVVHGETGILLESRDPQAWVDTLLALAQDPGRAQHLGAAGRQRVESQFTERRMLLALSDLYRAALRCAVL